MASHDPRERFALLAVWLLRLSLAQFIHERSQGLTAPLHGTYLFLAIIDIFAGIPGTVYCCVGSRPIESCISADEFYCFLEAIRHHHWRDDIPCENVKMWGMDELAAHLARRQRVIKAGPACSCASASRGRRWGTSRRRLGCRARRFTCYFRDKEDVFEAVVAYWIDDSLARIGAGLGERAALGEKLRFACETWCMEGLELALANPDVRDMSGLPAVRKSYAQFEGCLTEILRDDAERSELGVSAGDLARVMISSMQGFKQTVRSLEEMRHLIAVQARTIERALAAGS